MKINFPQYKFRTRQSEKGLLVFDRLRNKFVPLTPEEAVRQNFVEYLISEKQYPAGLMNNEVAILQNNIRRRCDTVVFDRKGNPWMIVEYKSSSVKITQEVFNQIYRYNLVLKVRFLIVTNGDDLYCCRINYDSHKAEFISDIPVYLP